MITRDLQSPIELNLRRFPIVLLYGARQTGKTTLVRMIAERRNATVWSLDDPDTLSALRAGGAELLGSHREQQILDEIQYWPEGYRILKLLVDRDRRPGRFLLTGSTPSTLIQGAQTALAGRAAICELMPLSSSELLGAGAGSSTAGGNLISILRRANSPSQLLKLADRRPRLGERDRNRRVMFGGLPPAWLASSRDAWIEWMRAYWRLYLDRDVLPQRSITIQDDFVRLMKLVAASTGGILSVTSLARDAQIPPTTAREFLQIMQRSCQITLLGSVSGGMRRRLRKAPKLYWFDSGVAAYLRGISTWDEAVRQNAAGALLETWVVQEMRHHLQHAWPQAHLGYFRDRSGHEVDLVISAGNRMIGIEVKSASTLSSVKLGGLQAFLNAAGSGRAFGVVLYLGAHALPLDKRIVAIPW